MKSVLTVGNALTDILAVLPNDSLLKEFNLPIGSMQWVEKEEGEQILERLQKFDLQYVPGGSAANTISGTAILGMPSGFIGKVGDDSIGRLYKEGMEKMGVKPHLLLGKAPSGRAMVLITPPNSERTFADYMGATLELCAEDLDEEIFKEYDIVHIEGYLVQNQDLVRRIAQLAHSFGKEVSIDMASYNVVEENREFLKEIVERYVDVLFANESEAQAFTGKTEYAAAEEIAKMCKVAVVKLGGKGSIVRSGEMVYTIEPMKANKVDTTGAGDIYASGFLYGYSLGLPLEVCGKIGTILSSKVIEIVGPKLDEKRWAEAKKEIAQLIG